ncbi:MAG: DUF72 domain-containing protein [Anaerolineales bacterium]|nr:DUF72 domain-containing protein [Anaerolineales bacterium]
MSLYIGGPVWAYKGWVGNFFPEGTKPSAFLREYTRRLTTVEGNTTFYAVPSAKTLAGWLAEMPEGFHFCPKLPRYISHSGSLANGIDEALQFADTMGRLGDRLGPMFLQLPPRYGPSQVEDLRTFLEAWPAEYRLAVEVRHADWFDPPESDVLTALLNGLNLGRVVFDTRPIRILQGDAILKGSAYERLLEARQRKPDVPVVTEPTGPFIFLRYIGHPRMDLNLSYLDEWSAYLASWLRQGMDAYVFCHCPDEGLDPALCRELYRRVSVLAPLPELPWDQADRDTPIQPRLF